MSETSCTYSNGSALYFSSDERRWINKIRKLKEEYPDQIEILAEPENNDGCIYCTLPSAWLKIKPPAKRAPLSEEQKTQARERMMKARENLAQMQGVVEIHS